MSTKIQFPNDEYTIIFHIFYIEDRPEKNDIVQKFLNWPKYVMQIITIPPLILDLPPNYLNTKKISIKIHKRTKHHPNQLNMSSKQTMPSRKSQTHG